MSPYLILSSMKKLTYTSLFLSSAIVRHQSCCVRAFRPLTASSIIVDGGVKLLDHRQHQRGERRGFHSYNTVRYLSTKSTSSNFQAPEPPQSKGEAVYSDIDITSSQASESSTLRNNDENSVFVVSGASRGIGLEFVKALSKRTKVGCKSGFILRVIRIMSLW